MPDPTEGSDTEPSAAEFRQHFIAHRMRQVLGDDATLVQVTHDSETPFRAALDRVGDKWSLLILSALVEGTKRFTEIEQTIPGVSQKMLATTLRSLERDGLVIRTAYAETPPRVEYSITELARSLQAALVELARWSYLHEHELHSNRDRFDAAAVQPDADRPAAAPRQGTRADVASPDLSD